MALIAMYLEVFHGIVIVGVVVDFSLDHWDLDKAGDDVDDEGFLEQIEVCLMSKKNQQ